MRSIEAEERLRTIVRLVEERGQVSVPELAARFAVSEVTVRHDLTLLSQRGLVVRSRGGALAPSRDHTELDFDVRLRLQTEEKRAVAAAAAQFVEDGEAIALDASTTAYYLALALAEKRELVVVTNSLRVAQALVDRPEVTVILPGGVLRRAAVSLVGDLGTHTLGGLRIQKGFFGARGLSLEHGLMDLNPEEVRLKRALAEACDRVVALVDHTKWRRSALLPFCGPERIDRILTDDRAPYAEVEAWRARGVEVVAVPVPRRTRKGVGDGDSGGSGTKGCAQKT